MIIRIFETVDITERVIDLSRESATYNNIDGLIAPVRNVVCQNADGALSPNANNGIFSDKAYRNQFLEIFEDTGELIFKGLIEGVDERVDIDGNSTVTIRSRDALGSFLEWPVRAGVQISGIAANAARAAGLNTIQIPSTIPIPQGAFVSTSPAGVPSYQVTGVVIGANQTLTIDRGLESPLTIGQALYFIVPEVTTVPEALRKAFLAPLTFYGLSGLIGSSFSALHTQELAAGRTIWNIARVEQGISLSKYVGKLLSIGGFYLTRGDNGVFELVDKLAYAGESIIDSIDDADILGPVETIDDQSRLYYGMTALYVSGNSVQSLKYDMENGYDPIQVPQYEPGLNSALIEAYGATIPFNPIEISGGSLGSFNFLYATEASAKQHIQKILGYSAYQRIQLRFGVKPFKSGNPDAPIDISFFKKFLLNLTVSENEVYTNEPCVVLAYEKNKDTGEYTGVLVELTNNPAPNLPVA